MKQKKKQHTRRETAYALLKFVEEHAKEFRLENRPTPLIVNMMNAGIKALSCRGIKISDWDDREKTVYGFKILGSSVFLLAPKDEPETEGDADGKSGKPGGQ